MNGRTATDAERTHQQARPDQSRPQRLRPYWPLRAPRAPHESAAGNEIDVGMNDLADQASIEYLTRFDAAPRPFPGEAGRR